MWADIHAFVYRNARKQGASHFDAEDIAQDVLETAYVHLEDVDPGRRHAWLTTVTRNALVNRARRSGRVHTVSEVPEAVDPALGPDEVALRSEDRETLLEAMACLPERDAHLLEVRYLSEHTVAETARELGMSVGATKVALHRARRRLRVVLEANRATGGGAVAGIAERAVNALTPYIGPALAELCVRGTAVAIEKTFETLTDEDAPALEDRARRTLEPVLPPDAVARVLAEIRGGSR